MKTSKALIGMILAIALLTATVPLALAQGVPQRQQQVMQQHMKQLDDLNQRMSQIQDRAHHINQSTEVSLGDKSPKSLQYNHIIDMSIAMEKMAAELKVVIGHYKEVYMSVDDPKLLTPYDHMRDNMTKLTDDMDETLKSMEQIAKQQR